MNLVHQLINLDPNLISIVLLVVFFSLEQFSVCYKGIHSRGLHLLHNVILQVLLVVMNLFFATVLVQCIEWLNGHEVGLMYLFEMPAWLKLVLGVLSFDFVTYWIHRASHKVPFLWRLHRVHHSDTHMDSSTTFRFHPLELILIYQTGNILTAAIFGSDVTALSVYYLVLSAFFFVEHSALRYPQWINNTLGLVLVMPDHHRVHHHRQQQYTDSNFADIFIIWNRPFGTYQLVPTQAKDYGLDEFDAPQKQTFHYLLKSPFLRVTKDDLAKDCREEKFE